MDRLKREDERRLIADGRNITGEVAHILRLPYCSQCGGKAFRMKVEALVTIECPGGWREENYSDSRPRDLQGEEVRRISLGRECSPVSSAFEDVETDFRKGRHDVGEAMDVYCEKGHMWRSRLDCVELAPAACEEEEEANALAD